MLEVIGARTKKAISKYVNNLIVKMYIYVYQILTQVDALLNFASAYIIILRNYMQFPLSQN